MAQHTFSPNNGFNMSSGLVSRRGGQSLKPLNELALKPTSQDAKENTVPTPRTSRGHMLANLRTAPKTAAATSFAAADSDLNARNRSSLYAAQEAVMNNGPKTSLPNNNCGVQPQFQPQGSANWMAYGQQQQQQQQQQHFTPEQILAPPEIHIDEQGLDNTMDPELYDRLMQQNMELAQQRYLLQQQLLGLTQAQQQLEAMNLNGNHAYANMYQQQLLQQQQQHQLALAQAAQAAQVQPKVYSYIDATGQQAYFIDQSGQLGAQFQDQVQYSNAFQSPQSSSPAPRFEVSPPREGTPVFRRTSPARRNESPLLDDPTPLPPPSANAFRRGHKKSGSLMLKDINNSLSAGDSLKPAGPRTANPPATPLTGGYGPGQARAGEHPIRQPRGPPSIEELKAKPTSKMEGSKNFVLRTRRSAINNLKRAGFERRKVTGSSSTGPGSPVSEMAEEAQSPLSDNESDSGRSGSGSLNGEDVEPSVPSSRTSTGSWGAIGSDRPSSAQKARKSADSVSSGSGDEAASNGSFASVFKRTGHTDRSSPETAGRKAPMMVLTNAEKRRNGL